MRGRIGGWRARRSIALGLTTLLTAGCSLVNPHVFRDRYDVAPRVVRADGAATGQPTASAVGLEDLRARLRTEQNALKTELAAQRAQLAGSQAELRAKDEQLSAAIVRTGHDLDAIDKEPDVLERRRTELAARAANLDKTRAELAAKKGDTKTVEAQQAEVARGLAAIAEAEKTRPARRAAAETLKSDQRRERRTVRIQREAVDLELARIDERLRVVEARRDALSLPIAPPDEEVSVVDAYAHSAKVKRAYRDALGDQARLQSWLGLGLIPLSAAAIGLGATGAGGHSVLALGLTGATGLGVGTWLTNRPAQLAYVAGLKAVTCAEDAVSPLAVAPATRAEFRLDRQALAYALEEYQAQAGVVLLRADAAEAAASDPALTEDSRLDALAAALRRLVASARTQVTEGRSLVTSAREANEGGAGLDQAYGRAGRELVNAVNRIADEVDQIIVQTQRDLSALSTIISGLGAAYQGFTTVPEALKPSDKKPAGPIEPKGAMEGRLTRVHEEAEDRVHEEREKLVNALTDLQRRSATLEAATRRVAARVNVTVKDGPLERLKRDCGVSAEGIITTLTVDPAGPFNLDEGTGGTVTFTAKGGQTPYGATLAGPSVTGFDVRQPVVWGPAFNVVVGKDVPAKEYVINVHDGARQTKEVRLVVKPKTEERKDEPSKEQPSKDEGLVRDLKTVAKSLNDAPPTVTVSGVKFMVTKATVDEAKKQIVVELAMQPATSSSGLVTEEAVKKAILAESSKTINLGLKVEHLSIKDWKTLEGKLPKPGSAVAPAPAGRALAWRAVPR